jgi:hypothetical protein
MRCGLAPTEQSTHDNHLVGYDVDCERAEIRLRTEFRDVPAGESIEKRDVLFRAVEAYHFHGDNLATIIFDVTEIDIEDLVRDEAGLFESRRNYCWPGPWNISDEAVSAHFRDRGARAFVLHSSYGMGGWVIAHSMSLIDLSGE